MLPTDLQACDMLLHNHQPAPQGTMFKEDLFDQFMFGLGERSMARVFLDFHPLLIPSAENLCPRGHPFDHIIDGYVEEWNRDHSVLWGRAHSLTTSVDSRCQFFSQLDREIRCLFRWPISLYTPKEDSFSLLRLWG